MSKKTLLLAAILAASALGGVFIYSSQKNNLANPISNINITPKNAKPSQTFIEYADPAGFTFSYPDNLSISKTEIEDQSTYADLQLFSKEVDGSVNLKIADSKFKSLGEWFKQNQIPSSNTPIEKKLGNLKALEVKTADRLYLGALDQGVLFTVEVPLVEQDFWLKVYDKVLADFTFGSPEVANSAESAGSQPTNSSNDVVFEGEEVVE
ncbi:hypothetical protein HYS97_02225 [Candidatus Daviesbacteria bacterium]|nr:hypothetical protein [Candidatus Daviesbacteria bacterium]